MHFYIRHDILLIFVQNSYVLGNLFHTTIEHTCKEIIIIQKLKKVKKNTGAVSLKNVYFVYWKAKNALGISKLAELNCMWMIKKLKKRNQLV